MKRCKVMIAFLAIALAMAGCTKKEDAGREDAGRQMGGVDIRVILDLCDTRSLYEIVNGEKDYLAMDIENRKAAFMRREFRNSAWAKRKTALLMGRDLFTYRIKCLEKVGTELIEYPMCMKLDGVSGFIYNLSYLCSIPKKSVMAFVVSLDVPDYLENMVLLLYGGCCAVVGIVLSPIVGTICHPIETLANLTVGVLYFDKSWWTYVLNTNLLATIWDIVWGAVLYPLWQALTFRWWAFLALPLQFVVLWLIVSVLRNK